MKQVVIHVHGDVIFTMSSDGVLRAFQIHADGTPGELDVDWALDHRMMS